MDAQNEICASCVEAYIANAIHVNCHVCGARYVYPNSTHLWLPRWLPEKIKRTVRYKPFCCGWIVGCVACGISNIIVHFIAGLFIKGI